jgi:hypothetical protein
MPLASPKYPFEEWAVKGAPEDPGVYALYTGNTLVCIGVAMARRKDDHIRARLLEHFKTNRHGITQYQWEITLTPLSLRAEYLSMLTKRLPNCEEVFKQPTDDADSKFESG